MNAVYLGNLARLLTAMNRHIEAEPLLRRALAIDEKRYGPNHPSVAIDLSNLAQLLQSANRLVEAEPPMWQALLTFLKFTRTTDPEYSNLRAAFGNYKRLLEALHLNEAQMQARLASLGSEAGYGADEWRSLQTGL
jgi:tetratricopeptide (TPR) repeat protein